MSETLMSIRAKLQQLQMKPAGSNSFPTPDTTPKMAADRTAEQTVQNPADGLGDSELRKTSAQALQNGLVHALGLRDNFATKVTLDYELRDGIGLGDSREKKRTDERGENLADAFHLRETKKSAADIGHSGLSSSTSFLNPQQKRMGHSIHAMGVMTPASFPAGNGTAELTDRSMSGSVQLRTESTGTFEVQDHKAKMKRIEETGNSPEAWKAYIDFLKSIPCEGNIRARPLSEAYSRAFTGILNNRNRQGETSVQLVMEYVQFCSESSEWDTMETILDLARACLQSYAVITVAAAEVQLVKGDTEKGLSILSKALARGRAQPRELLVRAIQAADAGQTKLLLPSERNMQASWVFGRGSNHDTITDELRMPPPISGCFDGTTDGHTTEGASVSGVSLNAAQLTHPSSASKPAPTLRHFNSTPEVRSNVLKSQLQNSELKIRKLGMPMRVRKPIPMSPAREDSYQPVDKPGHPEPAPPHQPFPSLLSSSSSSPPLPSSVAPPAQRCLPVISTPSGQGVRLQAAGAQTPSGDYMETVTVQGEQYCVLKKVGRGGSAQVYMVLDGSKNIRALKVVDLEGVGSDMVEGFRNEISLLQRLQYCHSVIKMFNFELNENLKRLYVVLEFGETDLSGFFATRAKQKEGLDPTLIKFYWAEMLRAVNALHKEGIIHSDLKPANFMLVAGNLKLIDFGIANALQQDKTSVLKDSRVGTPSYMSPEAIMAACDDANEDDDEKENEVDYRPRYKVGVRSDVWSLGCILYNMVYGRTPFQSIRNNMARLQAITNPGYAIKFPPLQDPQLLDVLQKCLTREVKSRPTTSELLNHPYLTAKDKGLGAGDGPPEHPTPSTPLNKAPLQPMEASRLQELLKSHLAQGSPGTASAVSRVMGLLQQMESSH